MKVGGPASRTVELPRWRRRFASLARCALLASLATSSLSAGSARAGTWAVVADEADADALAAEVRTALTLPPGAVLIHETTLKERLSPPLGPVTDAAVIADLIDAADRAFNAVEHEKSVGILEQVIESLEADSTFSSEKLALLQTARLQAARRLLGLAGPGETGKAETKNGARARAHLAAALRADPTLVLDPAKSPPKLRSLLALATDDVKRGGHGGVSVTSVPAGSTVLLEGRPMGQTPLVTADTIASGPYRLWLEKDGRKSLVRRVDIGRQVVGAEINLVIEGALRPAGPGLTAPLQPLVGDEVGRIAQRLGVERLAVVGHEGGEDWVAVFDGRGTLLDAARGPGLGTPRLASTVTTTTATPTATTVALVPASFYSATPLLASTTTTAPVGDDDDGFPWLGVGIGAAAVVGVGVVAGGIAGLVWLATPEETTVGVLVRRAP